MHIAIIIYFQRYWLRLQGKSGRFARRGLLVIHEHLLMQHPLRLLLGAITSIFSYSLV